MTQVDELGGTTKRCDGCKFWNRAEGKNYDMEGLGLCERARPFWDASDWEEADDNSWTGQRVLKPEHRDDLMFVQDGSDYCAFLLTRAEFFCAHHTEKVSQP